MKFRSPDRARAAIFFSALAVLLSALASARADDPSITNYLWGAGYEAGRVDATTTNTALQIGFQLFNTSTNNIADNNMISFTYPAGTNQGVYRVEFQPHPQHWTAAITDNVTTITNPGYDLAPGKGVYIFIYSVFTNIGTDTATALAAGSGGGPLPFNSLQMYVPVDPPPPSPLVTGLSAPNPHTLTLANLTVGGTTVVMQTSNPLSGNWSVATSFVATATTTNLLIGGGSSPTMIYRVLQTHP